MIITIYVRGGVIQDIDGIEPGQLVKVIDYDVQGCECYDTDDQGQPCSINVWGSKQGGL